MKSSQVAVLAILSALTLLTGCAAPVKAERHEPVEESVEAVAKILDGIRALGASMGPSEPTQSSPNLP